MLGPCCIAADAPYTPAHVSACCMNSNLTGKARKCRILWQGCETRQAVGCDVSQALTNIMRTALVAYGHIRAVDCLSATRLHA